MFESATLLISGLKVPQSPLSLVWPVSTVRVIFKSFGYYQHVDKIGLPHNLEVGVELWGLKLSRDDLFERER